MRAYMAPEIWNRQEYGRTADIYSLGMVLYRYLNGNRMPFIPTAGSAISPDDRNKAFEKRMCGERMLPPVNGSTALKEAVLKALEYEPENRYQTALEFRQALEGCEIYRTRLQFPPQNNPRPEDTADSREEDYNQQYSHEEDRDSNGYGDDFREDRCNPKENEENTREYEESDNAKKKRVLAIVLSVAAGLLLAVLLAAAAMYYANKPLKNGMTRDEAKEIFEEGAAYFDNGKYERAMEWLGQVPSDSRQYKKAQSLLAEAKSTYQQKIIDRVDSYIAKNEFEPAFELIDEAQEQLPEDTGLQTAYDNVYSAWKDSVFVLADNYAADGQYEEAVKHLQDAKEGYADDMELQAAYEKAYSVWKAFVLEQAAGKQQEEVLTYLGNIIMDYPDDTDLQAAFNSTQAAYQGAVRGNALQEADNYAASGDYAQAITVIKKALEKNVQDRELAAKLDVYEEIYKNEILGQMSTIYGTNGYEGIMSLLAEAIKILPDDEDLLREYKLWESRKPILLTEIEEYSKDGVDCNGSSGNNTDNYGTSYLSYIVDSSGYIGSKHYIEYYLGGEYSIFKASVYVTEHSQGYSTDEAAILIYGDDELLFSYSDISSKDKPKEISVDISGVEFLKIKFSNCIFPRGIAKVGLANPMVGW